MAEESPSYVADAPVAEPRWLRWQHLPCARCQEGERVHGQSYCKGCLSETRRARRKRTDPAVLKDRRRRDYDRERAKKTPDQLRDDRYRWKFGITLDDYHKMLEKQDGRCGICKSTEAGGRWGTFAVDHCHTTGKVRGLLCSNCNNGIGKLGDTVEALESALDYLRRSQNG